MMNEQHPIDDLFQRGLSQQSVPPPMHIWERIEESRGSRHRSKLVLLRQRFAIVSGTAAVLLLGVWLNWPKTPDLGSFPLRTSRSTASVEQKTQQAAKLELPIQQAGVIPGVSALIGESNASNTAAVKAPVVVQQDPTPAAILRPETTAVTLPVQDIALQGSGLTTPVDQMAKAGRELSLVVPLLQSTRADLPTALARLDAAPLPVPETGCARFSEGRPAVFLALTAGPSLPGRTFAAKDEEFEEYATQRQNTESVRLSYGAGARLSVVFPWGGAIRSGVNFTQLNEQLVFKNSRVRQTIITEILGPNGEVIGTDSINITDTTILKYSNRYRLIDIPLQLGYEVRYNKVTLAANVGASLNVAFAQKGNFLSPQDLLPTRFNSDDPSSTPIYKTKVGLGLHASLGLHYQLNDRLDLMAEPYLRYYPQSFTQDDYPITQKYLVGGIGLGLRVLL